MGCSDKSFVENTEIPSLLFSSSPSRTTSSRGFEGNPNVVSVSQLVSLVPPPAILLTVKWDFQLPLDHSQVVFAPVSSLVLPPGGILLEAGVCY